MSARGAGDTAGEAAAPGGAPGPATPSGTWADRVTAVLLEPERLDPQAVRLGGVALLCAWALLIFRGVALETLAVAVAAGALALGVPWFAFHRLGLRAPGAFQPGLTRGAATALLLFVLLPPNLPPLLVAALVVAAVAVEGRLRRAAMPVALGGVGAAWLVAWAWQARTGTGFVSPFDLRQLDDPLRLWGQFGISVDPTRLYAGNVAGLLGATSFGAAALVVAALSFVGEVAWGYLLAFFAVVAVGALAMGVPLTVAVVEGPALAFAGLMGAQRRLLPHDRAWRLAAGGGAALVAVLLVHIGMGVDAFGVGVCGVAGVTTAVQLAGVTERWHPREPALAGRATIARTAALALFPPAGWVLVALAGDLERGERRRLVLVSAALLVVAGALALAWVYYLRLPR